MKVWITLITIAMAGTGLFLMQAIASEHEGEKKEHTMPSMTHQEMKDHMKMMNDMMVKHLQKAEEYDLEFLDIMILHHQGAIAMAKDALKNAKHDELKEISRKMIEEQQKEVDHLKALRKEWYKKEDKEKPKDKDRD